MSAKALVNIVLLIIFYVCLSTLLSSINLLKEELKRAEMITDKIVDVQNQLLDHEQKEIVKNFFPGEEE
jgi:hypothetical protein